MQVEITGNGSGSGTGIQKVADAAELALLPGADGDFAVQVDTNDLYQHDGVSWVLFAEDTNASDLNTVISDLSNHIGDTTDAHDASAISFVNTTSGLVATEVQAAIDEVEGRLQTTEGVATGAATAISDHLSDTVDAHDASAISVTPAGDLAATDVQAALTELQGDIDTLEAASHAALTLGAFDTTANANGLTLTGQVLQLARASQTHPGGVSTASQSFAGEKHFVDGVHVGSNAVLGGDVILEVTSTSKGSRPFPVMDNTQRNNITGPNAGTMVYNTTTKHPEYYNGTLWQPIGHPYENTTATITAGGNITPANARSQFLPVVGDGAAVSVANIVDTNAIVGDLLIIIGTSDTNTVTINSGTDVDTNGSCTLGAGDIIEFMYYNSIWYEKSRSN